MKKSVILLVVAMIMMTVFTSTVFARSYNVKFINNSSRTMTGLYLAYTTNSNSYTGNLVPREVRHGEAVNIRIDDTEKYRFEILATTRTPEGKLYKNTAHDVDLDQAELVTLTDDSDPNVGIHWHVEYEKQIGPWRF